MKIDGGCHCGALSFEAEVDPDQVAICHCTDCQKMSGTAFRTIVRATDENFRLLSGEPTTYVKIAESGAEREMAFCDTCGTQIYGTSAGAGPSVGKYLLLAYLPPEYAVEGTDLFVEYMTELYPVKVAVAGSTPLFDPENERMKQ